MGFWERVSKRGSIMGEGEVIECPECRSNEVVLHKAGATALGAATRTVVSGYECVDCGCRWAPDVELTGQALRPIRR
jgi:DNA-directed RNA polymerase subunit RPC12/RpoP